MKLSFAVLVALAASIKSRLWLGFYIPESGCRTYRFIKHKHRRRKNEYR